MGASFFGIFPNTSINGRAVIRDEGDVPDGRVLEVAV
jgi:hypothetical protein